MKAFSFFCLLLLTPLLSWAGEFEKNTGQIRYSDGQLATDVFYRLRTDKADWYFTTSGFSIVEKTRLADSISIRLKRTDFILDEHAGVRCTETALSTNSISLQLADGRDFYFLYSADYLTFSTDIETLTPLTIRIVGGKPALNPKAGRSYQFYVGEKTSLYQLTTTMSCKQTEPDGPKPMVVGNRINYVEANFTNVYWLTYCGGTDADELYGEALCSNGDLIVAGRSQSLDFPVDTNAVQVANGGSYDAVVARVKPDGTKRWATYLGGSGFDGAWGAAVAGDDILICGNTNSANFPVLNAAQPTIGGSFDAFVARFDSTGNLIWSTYYGGSLAEQGLAIATDGSDNIYIGGSANSPNLPGASLGWQTSPGGMLDGFIARLSSTGTPIWATFCGGTATEDVHDLTTGPGGLIAACGETYSNNFPSTPNAFQTNVIGLNDAYLLVMDSSGNRIYNTCLGGFSNEDANGVRFDAAGNLYLTGFTQSIDFPVTGNQFQSMYNGGSDVFLACFNTSYQLTWATFFGSANNELAGALTLSGKYIYVAGTTDSPNLPVSVLADQDTIAGVNDGFYCKFDTTGNWIMSSFLGGSQFDGLYGIVVNADTMAYLVGNTFSNNLPLSPGVWQPTYVSLGDAFIAMRDVREELIGNASGSAVNSAATFALWPNPAQTQLNLQTSEPIEQLEIIDALGRVVWEQKGKEEVQVSIAIAHFPAGIYLVRMTQRNGAISTQKFVH